MSFQFIPFIYIFIIHVQNITCNNKIESSVNVCFEDRRSYGDERSVLEKQTHSNNLFETSSFFSLLSDIRRFGAENTQTFELIKTLSFRIIKGP